MILEKKRFLFQKRSIFRIHCPTRNFDLAFLSLKTSFGQCTITRLFVSYFYNLNCNLLQVYLNKRNNVQGTSVPDACETLVLSRLKKKKKTRCLAVEFLPENHGFQKSEYSSVSPIIFRRFTEAFFHLLHIKLFHYLENSNSFSK